MTEAQRLKLTQIVSYYPVTEEDNIRHIEKGKQLSKDVTERQEPTNGSPTDPKHAEYPPGSAQLPLEQPKHVESQPTEDCSPKNPLITRNDR